MSFMRDTFFTPRTVQYDVPGRAKLAGQLMAACVDLDMPFTGEVAGWRIVIARVTEHREMTKGDLGLEL